jgi:hypothetical protein
LIVAVLTEGDAGVPVAQVVRKHGIGRASVCCRLYCFLMTSNAPLTEGVKGFRLEFAINPRLPEPEDASSSVTGFVVSCHL